MEKHADILIPIDIDGKVVTFFMDKNVHAEQLIPLVINLIKRPKKFILGPVGSKYYKKTSFIWVHPYKFFHENLTILTPQNLSGILHITKEFISKAKNICIIGDFLDTVLANVEFKPAYNFILSFSSIIKVENSSAILFLSKNLHPKDKYSIVRKFSDYIIDVSSSVIDNKLILSFKIYDILNNKSYKFQIDPKKNI